VTLGGRCGRSGRVGPVREVIGLEERPRQAVGVFLTLVGFQQVHAQAHHVHTDEATVAVRIGKALIYLHDEVTTTRLAHTWEGLGGAAVGLPREIHPSLVAPLQGAGEPAVLIDARDGMSMAGHVVRKPGHYTQLRVVLGRTVFDIRDVGAYGSVTAAFRQAADLARTTFGTGPRLVASHEAAARQAAALLVPPHGRRRVAAPKRRAPAGAEPPPRPVLRHARER